MNVINKSSINNYSLTNILKLTDELQEGIYLRNRYLDFVNRLRKLANVSDLNSN